MSLRVPQRRHGARLPPPDARTGRERAARRRLAVVPRTRGVRRRGRLAAPEKWDAAKGEGVLWKTAIPGLAVSSPIVWGDRVFVTTAVSSDPKAVFRHGLYGDVEPSKDVTKHSWRVLAPRQEDGQGALGARRARGRAEDEAPPEVEPGLCDAGHGRQDRGRVTSARKASTRYDLAGQAALEAGPRRARTPAGSTTPTTSGAPPARPIIYKDLVIVQCDIQKGSFVAAYRAEGRRAGLAHRARRDPVLGDADGLRGTDGGPSSSRTRPSSSAATTR